jgi:hemerythrin
LIWTAKAGEVFRNVGGGGQMSDFFVWKDAQLNLNVAEMDQEHKELVRKMNALHHGAESKASKRELETLIKDLAQFTVKHFADEEKFMESTGFPGLNLHKVIHKQLLKQFNDHVEAFKSSGTLSPGFFNFLSVWLTGHIRGIDRQYADHAHAHGKKSA